MVSTTAQNAIAAYGGDHFWSNASKITAQVSAHGLAFMMKGRPSFRRASLEMDVHRPVSRITPIGRTPGVSGVLSGRDVWLEGPDGSVLAVRTDARTHFPGGRRAFYWDDLDMAYFANYAFWNYFTLPALLTNGEIEWHEREPGVLQARFPMSIPTHSGSQEFRFDPLSGLLLQHNYTAEIISRYATAANVVDSHMFVQGIPLASRRTVTPRRRDGRARNGPLLIGIEVHAFSIATDNRK